MPAPQDPITAPPQHDLDPTAEPTPHRCETSHPNDEPAAEDEHQAAGNLFDVIPPDDPRDIKPATDADLRWYRGLRTEIAEILVRVVSRVHSTEDQRANVSDYRRTSREIRRRAGIVGTVYLANDPPPVLVTDAIADLARRFGLITTVTEIGPRYRDYCGNGETFTFDDALEITDLALRGQWPPSRGTP